MRISYIDCLNTPKIRQNELLETYYFLCQCVKCLDFKCLDIMLSAACPNSNCENAIPMQNISNINTLNCSQCSTELTDEFIRNYKEVMEFTELQIHNMVNLTCIL